MKNSCSITPDIYKKELDICPNSFLWCRRRDLNPHGFPHTPLKRARIPIPSRRHISIIVFSCQVSFSLCDGSCFLETTLSKNDTQSFFSAECHVDINFVNCLTDFISFAVNIIILPQTFLF